MDIENRLVVDKGEGAGGQERENLQNSVKIKNFTPNQYINIILSKLLGMPT